MPLQNWKDKIIKASQFSGFNYDQDSLNDEKYPYAMICFSLDDYTTIAVGTDPLSPRDFIEKNMNSSYMLDLTIPPRNMLTMQGQKTVYYAKKVEPVNEVQNGRVVNLEFIFESSDHIRYENGKHVSGPHGGARRAVKVEKNIDGGQGYTVTLYNLDGNHPIWQNNVQMAPKQMKIIEQTADEIVLRGYGQDRMGASFDDYGLTIKLKNEKVENCILHMYDRGVDIEYLPK